MTRAKVYKLIDGERAYQDGRWVFLGKDYQDSTKSVAEWLVYIEQILAHAKRHVYELEEKESLAHVRKIAALCVACMEYNKTPAR